MQYKTHDDETLRYLEQVLYRIDKTKVLFKRFHPVNKATDEGHFNFPKFYAMTHYTSCIQEYGAADNFDTKHSEAAHKYHVKVFYGRTNKRQGYEVQICLHNTRRINMLAMTNVLFYKKSRYITQSGEAQVSVPTQPQNLSQLGWEINHTNSNNICLHSFNTDFWRTAAEVAIRFEINNFIDALAVFVRESRKQLDGVPIINTSIVQREPDSSWVKDMLVALHPSI